LIRGKLTIKQENEAPIWSYTSIVNAKKILFINRNMEGCVGVKFGFQSTADQLLRLNCTYKNFSISTAVTSGQKRIIIIIKFSSIQFFIISVLHQQPEGQLQMQHKR
jgi:hypothetical protein